MKVISVSDWDANMNDMLRGRNEHEIYDMGYGVNDIYIENENKHLRDNAPLFKFCPWCGREVKEKSE